LLFPLIHILFLILIWDRIDPCFIICLL
jgi:hypothetical protein